MDHARGVRHNNPLLNARAGSARHCDHVLRVIERQIDLRIDHGYASMVDMPDGGNYLPASRAQRMRTCYSIATNADGGSHAVSASEVLLFGMYARRGSGVKATHFSTRRAKYDGI